MIFSYHSLSIKYELEFTSIVFQCLFADNQGFLKATLPLRLCQFRADRDVIRMENALSICYVIFGSDKPRPFLAFPTKALFIQEVVPNGRPYIYECHIASTNFKRRVFLNIAQAPGLT